MSNNDYEFDMDVVNQFFAHDYYDRGMVKWQGFYLSDHTAAIKKRNDELNKEYEVGPQQTLKEISEILAESYNEKREVVIQLKEVNKDNVNTPDIKSVVSGYNENDIVINDNQLISIDRIRRVE